VDKGTKKLRSAQPENEVSLGVLIHQHVRAAVEQAVQEELAAVLGVELYERSEARRGERNGMKIRRLTGPTGPLELTLPRARLFTKNGSEEWSSKLLPRYQRRVREVNESVLAAYLSGANTRRIAGAMRPLLKAAPLSKSAVSRVIGTLKSELTAWEQRPLVELDVAFLYLDAIALRVRMDGRVTSVPVLVALAVLTDGVKQLVAMEMCGSESHEAWKGFLDDLVERGLRVPVLCIVDGNAGLRRALSTTWGKTPVQRCAVHKLRNLERKAPKHTLAEVKADFHKIVYADGEAAARKAHAAFLGKWKGRCPGVVKSLEEAGDELFTMYRFPKQHWKNIRTTNVIERLNGEFRRRVKTQGSLPSEDAALILLFGLISTGQIKLRKIDGYNKLAGVISEQMRRAG
jgi:putative transposase